MIRLNFYCNQHPHQLIELIPDGTITLNPGDQVESQKFRCKICGYTILVVKTYEYDKRIK
jgi:hypothetical protein